MERPHRISSVGSVQRLQWKQRCQRKFIRIQQRLQQLLRQQQQQQQFISNSNGVYNQPLQFQPTPSASTHGMATMPMRDPGQHIMLATGNVDGLQKHIPRCSQSTSDAGGKQPGLHSSKCHTSAETSIASRTTEHIRSRYSSWKRSSRWSNFQHGISASHNAQQQNTYGVGIPPGNGSSQWQVSALQVSVQSQFYKGPNLLPESAKKLMQAWMQAHIEHPFPDVEDKKQLALGRWNHCAANHQVVLQRKNEERSHETDQGSRRRKEEE